MTLLARKTILHHWPAARASRPLPGGQVHLWCVGLDRPADERARFERLLSAAEWDRAGRYRFPRDRERCVVRRGQLRVLLGAYLGEDPSHVQLGVGRYGKPELVGTAERAALRFNLSDSGPVALYAFADGAEIGVDVEEVRPMADADQVSRRFFSPSETAVLDAVPAGQKDLAFFHCWTRKEAFLKADGQGLFAPLDSFDVSLLPGEPAAIRDVRGPGPEAAKWSLYHLEPCAGYVGALAVPGHSWQLVCRRLGDE
jgi:4'-phosphopantetheinyl transferase